MRLYQCLCVESILESFAGTLKLVFHMKIELVIKPQEPRVSHKDSSLPWLPIRIWNVRQFGVKYVSPSIIILRREEVFKFFLPEKLLFSKLAILNQSATWKLKND